MVVGYLPNQQGNLRKTTASQLSPKVHMALQFLVRNYFCIENVVAIRFAKSVSKLPAVTYAESCALVHYDRDVTPGFHYHESDGMALYISDITGSTHARIIQCLKSSKPLAGFDADLSKFEDLAGTPPSGGNTQEDANPHAAEDG